MIADRNPRHCSTSLERMVLREASSRSPSTASPAASASRPTSATTQRIARAGVHYFISTDDAEYDFELAGRDDEDAANAVSRHLGAPLDRMRISCARIRFLVVAGAGLTRGAGFAGLRCEGAASGRAIGSLQHREQARSFARAGRLRRVFSKAQRRESSYTRQSGGAHAPREP